MPDADPTGAPADALLRGDNLVLDELGTLALRSGSAKINAAAYADLDIHSLATFVLNGTRYRMAGAGNSVYANGVAVETSLAGSGGDIAFGSHLGQMFFARSSSKKKYDGSTVRNWGIAMTGGAPTVAALASDSKVFASCDSSESPAFTAIEGTITGTYPTGQDGTANGALEVTPASTGRATVTKVFSSDQDFTTYAGAQIGVDEDIIEF